MNEVLWQQMRGQWKRARCQDQQKRFSSDFFSKPRKCLYRCPVLIQMWYILPWITSYGLKLLITPCLSPKKLQIPKKNCDFQNHHENIAKAMPLHLSPDSSTHFKWLQPLQHPHLPSLYRSCRSKKNKKTKMFSPSACSLLFLPPNSLYLTALTTILYPNNSA